MASRTDSMAPTEGPVVPFRVFVLQLVTKLSAAGALFAAVMEVI